MNNKGFGIGGFNVQTIIVGAFVAAAVGLAMGWIPNPFAEKGEVGIDLEIVYTDGSTLQIVPGTTYTLSYLGGLTIVDDTGKEIDSIRAKLWINPTLTNIDATDVTIDYTIGLAFIPAFVPPFSTPKTETIPANVKTYLVSSVWSFTNAYFDYVSAGTGFYTATFSYAGTGSVGEYSDEFTTSASLTIRYTQLTRSFSISAGVQTDRLQIVGN